MSPTRPIALPVALPLAAALLLVLALPAFWPGYLSRIDAADRPTHLHALLGTAWLLLLIAQPALVARGRLALHRRLGPPAALLGAGFVLSGVLVSHAHVARLTPAQLDAAPGFLYLALAMTLLHASALALALAWRRVPALHARYMACTLLALLDPVLARLLGHYGPALPADWMYAAPAYTLIGLCLWWLWRTLPARSPGRRGFGTYGLAVTAVLLAQNAVASTAAWRHFAQAFRALPIG